MNKNETLRNVHKKCETRANRGRRNKLVIIKRNFRQKRSYYLEKMTASSQNQSAAGTSPEGLRQYYVAKIEGLQLTVAERNQNLRRLQAQRNELNAKVRMLSEELQLLVSF